MCSVTTGLPYLSQRARVVGRVSMTPSSSGCHRSVHFRQQTVASSKNWSWLARVMVLCYGIRVSFCASSRMNRSSMGMSVNWVPGTGNMQYSPRSTHYETQEYGRRTRERAVYRSVSKWRPDSNLFPALSNRKTVWVLHPTVDGYLTPLDTLYQPLQFGAIFWSGTQRPSAAYSSPRNREHNLWASN